MPKIFISYRRDDAAGSAGRLYDRLTHEFGVDDVFMDVGTLQPGDDFVDAITEKLSVCDVLLAVIGRRWLTVTDAQGERRIDDAGDYLRIELETALERGVRMIPLLVEDGTMPRVQDLPETLQRVSRRQAAELRATRWRDDIDDLVALLKRAPTNLPSAPLIHATKPAVTEVSSVQLVPGSATNSAPVTKRIREWYSLPRAAADTALFRIREELRQENLADTEEPPLEMSAAPAVGDICKARTSDGTYNDLQCPRMGGAGVRFGRNVPLEETFPDAANLMNPSPRRVSLELLTRTTFAPATTLNVLAAAWIQFMVHDWFVHKKGTWRLTHDIPLDDGDRWHERPMRVPKTPADPPKVRGSTRPPAYINEHPHWWDCPHVYGNSASTRASLRAGRQGKVLVSPSGRLGIDPVTGREIPGFTENGWVGLSLLRALFALEHNAICDELTEHNPLWDDERLFQQARLVNSALLAKIHTIEWSTAILPRETLSTGVRSNWHGRFSRSQDVFRKLADDDRFSGIPGSSTEHHGVPFTLTEEFVSVHRMHALMPDNFTIVSAQSGQQLATADLPELSGHRGVEWFARFNPVDLFYSFGIQNPGALRLHNYPKFLQDLVQDNGERFDLGAVDILRDRERGVPRYNRLRQLLHKAPVRSFEEITDVPEWAEQMKRVYGDNINLVDTMVGLYAEPLQDGMGFSDTAFRIFTLMTARRLKSDRFLSSDYRPEMYTKEGIDWVEENSMTTIISRHFPSLAGAMELYDNNAFRPWKATP